MGAASLQDPLSSVGGFAANFLSEGYLVLPGVVPAERAHDLRRAATRLFDRDPAEAGILKSGDTLKLLRPADTDAAFSAAVGDPALDGIARLLLGDAAHRFFDQLVYKPAMQARGTPWHQDFAYAATPQAPEGAVPPRRHLHIWVALDPFDAQSGCIRFSPRMGSRLMPHAVYEGDPQGRRLLAIDLALWAELDATAAVCPVQPGDVTVHHDGTPHRNAANQTSLGRMFWVVSWERE